MKRTRKGLGKEGRSLKVKDEDLNQDKTEDWVVEGDKDKVEDEDKDTDQMDEEETCTESFSSVFSPGSSRRPAP